MILRTMRHPPNNPPNIMPPPNSSNCNKTWTSTISLLISGSTPRHIPHHGTPALNSNKTPPSHHAPNISLTQPKLANYHSHHLNSPRGLNGTKPNTNQKNPGFLIHFTPRLNSHHLLQPQTHPTSLLPICPNNHHCVPHPKHNLKPPYSTQPSY